MNQNQEASLYFRLARLERLLYYIVKNNPDLKFPSDDEANKLDFDAMNQGNIPFSPEIG